MWHHVKRKKDWTFIGIEGKMRYVKPTTMNDNSYLNGPSNYYQVRNVRNIGVRIRNKRYDF